MSKQENQPASQQHTQNTPGKTDAKYSFAELYLVYQFNSNFMSWERYLVQFFSFSTFSAHHCTLRELTGLQVQYASNWEQTKAEPSINLFNIDSTRPLN